MGTAQAETTILPPPPSNRVHPVLQKHAVALARAAILDHHQKDGSSFESEFIRLAVSEYLREISEWHEVDHAVRDLMPVPDSADSAAYLEAHREGYGVAVKAFDAVVALYVQANGSTPGVEDLFAEVRAQAFDA